jgi:hypothetical protein
MNMRKAIIAVVAAVAAITPTLLLAASTGVAHAYPACDAMTGSNRYYCEQACALHVNPQCYYGSGQAPAQTPRPVQTPKAPPTQAPPPTYAPPSVTPVQTPQVKPPPPPPPTTVPVVTPKISPPAPGAPRNASVVAAPKRLDASPDDIPVAKTAGVARINPADPPKPPTQADFNQQVQHVVSAHSSNVDVVKVGNQALARPRLWNYVDYDVYHRPLLYNPFNEAMTFRYFYDGAFREVSVPALCRDVLDVATVGVFPFTAVSDSYVASGSFTGGAWIPPDGWDGPPPPDYTPPPDPTVYQDVSADVPADNQTVQVGQVKVLGHDDSLPAGSQDAFLLDDSTLAWGQVNDPTSSTQITVTKTQSLPGVGPTDNGSFLVALTANEQPTHPWWPWALGGGVLVIALGLVAWVVIRRKRNAAV